MRILELRRILWELALALDGVGAGPRARGILELAEGLSSLDRRDVSELEATTLQLASPTTNDLSPGTPLQEPLATLNAFSAVLDRIAKPSAKVALNDLRTIMNDRQDMTIRSFIEALHSAFSPERPQPSNDESIVDAYVSELRETKHDDKRFPKLFEALSNDERLNKDDIVEIASKFAFKMAKSTTKKSALERIWKMHNASETFAAKSRAAKGKSAA